MAWSTPLTAVANAALTAAQWNASVRDNFAETAPAKATAAGTHFVGTGANTIAERALLTARIDTLESTGSTAYADLATAGPSITLTSSVKSLVSVGSFCQNSTALASAIASFAVSGSTTDAANDNRGAYNENSANAGTAYTRTTLIAVTAGSNTYQMKYRVGSGSGSFRWREITVMGF